MHKRKPALSKGGGTTKLSETLKIQAVGAGFLAKSNLCSSEAELVGGIDHRKLSKSKFTAEFYPFHRYAVPLPLQEVEAAPCALLIVIFTIREETLEQQNKRQLEHKRKAPLCKGSWHGECRD